MKVSLMDITVSNPTFVRVSYTLPDGEAAVTQQVRIGYFGDNTRSVEQLPTDRMGTVIFAQFSPAVSPGDMLYASFAPRSNPTSFLNEIHFRAAPDPPQNVMVNPASSNSFRVIFDLPMTNGYDGVKIRVNDELRETLLGSGTTSVIIGGLDPNTLYTFNVTSFVGIGGDEAESEIFSDTRILVNFNLDLQEETVLGLSWGQPEGSDYDGLRLDASFPPNSRTVDLDADALAYNLTALDPGTDHTVSLYKRMGNTFGDLVTQNTFQTLPATVSANSIDFSDNEDGDLIVSWNSADGLVDYYEINVTPGSLVVNVTSAEIYTFTTLDPSTVYTLRIKTFTGGFESTGVAEASRLTVPDPPSVTLERGSPRDSVLLMNITAPSGGYDDFLVTYSPMTGGSVVSQTVTDVSAPVAFDSLEPFTNYTFTVVSVFMNLNSSEVTATESTALSPPSGFMATSATFTEITLEWTAVPNAETYTLSQSPGNVPLMFTDQTSYTFMDLEPGTNYTFTIISSRPGDVDSEPTTVSTATEFLEPGEIAFENLTTDSISFTVGNASSVQGFQGYDINVEPQGPILSFDDATLTGFFRNTTPGELYIITSIVLGTDITFTSRERAKPLPPIGGFSTSSGPTSIHVEWNLPLRGTYTFFRVMINPTINTQQNFVEVDNLLPGTDYNVSVVSVSGTEQYQQISDPMVFQGITDNLTTGEIVFVYVTSSSFTAIWADIGPQPYIWIVTGMQGVQLNSGTNNGNMQTVDSLMPSQIYRFLVFNGVFQVIENDTVRTDPETPQPPTLTSFGPFSLSFEWAPTNTSFSAYRVYSIPNSFQRELVSTIPSKSVDLTYNQEGLRPSTEYVFEIETVLNASGKFDEQTSDAQSVRITTNKQWDSPLPFVSHNIGTKLSLACSLSSER